MYYLGVNKDLGECGFVSGLGKNFEDNGSKCIFFLVWIFMKNEENQVNFSKIYDKNIIEGIIFLAISILFSHIKSSY